MHELPVPLRIAIVDRDNVAAGVLKAIVETHKGVEDVAVFGDAKGAHHAFHEGKFNSVFIDLFSVGVEESLNFIRYIRETYPQVPFCLYSSQENLLSFPDVPEPWCVKFGHYYAIPKDQNLQRLAQAIEDILFKLSTYLLSRIARARLSELRTLIAQDRIKLALSPEQRSDIEEVTATVEKALKAREEIARSDRIPLIPGIARGKVEQLVSATLEQATRSLHTTSRVNIGILVFGVLLVTVSFIVAFITRQWEAVAFGGFGIAGIIASLITNPLRSIGISARRLVQVQIGYLSFLSQLAILNVESANHNGLERSKRLGEEMARTLQALEEYFGK